MEDDQRQFELMLLVAVCENHRDILLREGVRTPLLEDLERLIARAREELRASGTSA